MVKQLYRIIIIFTIVIASCYSFHNNRNIVRLFHTSYSTDYSKRLLSNNNELDSVNSEVTVSSEVKNNVISSLKYSSLLLLLADMKPALSADSNNNSILRPLAYSVEMTSPPCLQPRTNNNKNRNSNIITTLEQSNSINNSNSNMFEQYVNSIANNGGELSLLNRLKTESDILLLGTGSNNSYQSYLLAAGLLQKLVGTSKSDGKETVLCLPIIPDTVEARTALKKYFSLSNNNDESQIVNDLTAIITTSVKGAKDSKKSSSNDNSNAEVEKEVMKLLPLLRVARRSAITVVPMGLPAEVVSKVEESGILDGLSEDEKRRYIPDPQGFVDAIKVKGFRRYAEAVLQPVLDNESQFGIKVLQQEAIASSSARLAGLGTTGVWDDASDSKPQQKQVVVVLPSDDVVFGYGVSERCKRNLNNVLHLINNNKNNEESKLGKVYSVLLNPTAADSRSDTSQLRLALAYGRFLPDQRPLADFIWFPKSPPSKLITRPKNPIAKEGDKPAGESSIIGAF